MTVAYQRPKRFAKWIRLCGPRTGGLAEEVETVFLQRFLDAGYVPVNLECGDRGRAVSGLAIRLEKAEQGLFKSVTIQFDKYRDPRFQVAVDRERAGEQRPFDQANLVPRKGKYYHFWGKPWLAPNRFWSAKASARLARRLAGLFPQCEAFLENGVRGRNLSRSILRPVVGAPASSDPA